MRTIIPVLFPVLLGICLSSCHSYLTLSNVQDFEKYQQKKRIYVLQMRTVRDSTVHFSPRYPGRLINGKVFGPRQVLLYPFRADSVIYKKLKPVNVVKNDAQYPVAQNGITDLVCLIPDSTCIPFSEIEQMQIKKISHGKTAGLISGLAVGIGGILYLILVNMTLQLYVWS